MKKNGFTLIELLVTMAIIGLLAGASFTMLGKTRHLARGAYVINALQVIEKALIFKALDENALYWWNEDDFPKDGVNWGASIEKMVDDGIISEFLPSAPEIPSEMPDEFNKYDFEFLYDNDGDINTGDADDCFNFTIEGFNNNKNGVSIVINYSYKPGSDKYIQSFQYLDESIDGGDGPYCGRFREQYNPNQPNKRGFFRFYIDFDQTVNQ